MDQPLGTARVRVDRPDRVVRRLDPRRHVHRGLRTRQDGEKLWLKEIEPAPKSREKETARGRDRDRDRDMDRDPDKDNAGATDGPAERRGRRPKAASQ